MTDLNINKIDMNQFICYVLYLLIEKLGIINTLNFLYFLLTKYSIKVWVVVLSWINDDLIFRESL